MFLRYSIYIIILGNTTVTDFQCVGGITSDETGPKVQTPYGDIVGSYDYSYGGRKYEIFQGIPYAEPPVEKLRFAPPKPVIKWNNILKATKKVIQCIQYGYPSRSNPVPVNGQEDCLYLNIYSPVLRNENQLLPVVFAIHGGAFRTGRAYSNVTFLMDRDIIFVSVSYRLSIFGFLSTEDNHVSGNMGLKDQSMALRWIFENIRNFGGDPKRITLMGQSSGAASVHYHFLSPLSKGLFQNAISFSGSSLGAGKLHKNSLEKFQKLGTLMNCPMESISDTVECLRRKPAIDLAATYKDFLFWLSTPINAFGPVIEKNSAEPFIDRSPYDIIRSGHAADVLWVNSIVSEDGNLPGVEFAVNDEYLQEIDENWNSIAPHLLMYNFDENHDYYSTMIRQQYFGNEKITKYRAKTLISLLTDRIYCSSAVKAAKLQARKNKSPVFFFYYNFRALTSFSDTFQKNDIKEDFGVSHSDDIKMINGNNVIDPTRRPEDRAVQIKMLDMLVSLATEGFPNIGTTWKKVSSTTSDIEMLHFYNANDMRMESPINFCRHKFWEEINVLED